MQRRVEPEWLDQLPADDARAVRSRRDLRRLNLWMGNARIVADALQACLGDRAPEHLVELGAGDGSFLLSVARRTESCWRTNAVLVDRQDVVSAETRHGFAARGWTVRTETADVLDWLGLQPGSRPRAIVANLVLHHFTTRQLADLFAMASGTSTFFVACETRRSGFALTFARLVWIIGCNAVTRHDAAASVRAGFAGRELSSLWPSSEDWLLTEHRAGLFSHLFVARNREEFRE